MSFRAAGTGEWTAAVLNRPFTRGDALWTAGDAKAELQVGALVVRLGGGTALQASRLDDAAVQLALSAGAAAVRVHEVTAGQSVEVDTPQAAVALLEAGHYVLAVADEGNRSEVTVRSGRAEALVAGRAQALRAGEADRLRGNTPVEQEVGAAAGVGALEAWSDLRDRVAAGSESLRYVSRGMVGYEDLDRSGSWQQSADYGPLWVPASVPVGWAPYRYGHWGYVAPWGWTWIDDAAWGFAPFHYGRWAYYGGGWAWVPGPRAVVPVYAPALVAFSAGFGVGVALGAGIAWWPLGPREMYVPGYRASYAYLNAVNVTHVTQVGVLQGHPVFVNRNNYGVTAVPQSVMQHAAPVQTAHVSLGPQAITHGAVLSQAPVVPHAVALGGVPAGARPPPQALARPVVGAAHPAPGYRPPTGGFAAGARAPAYAAPSYHVPSYQAPSYHAPSYQAPSFRAPAYQAPSYHAPSYAAPPPHGFGGAPHGFGGGRGFGGHRGH